MSRFSKLTVIVLAAFLMTFPAAAQEPTIYIVRPGDNLFRIAQRYNVTVAAIAEANNIANTWQIFAGQRLIIPPREQPTAQPAEQPTEQPAPAAETRYHVIQWGESLSAIAARYGLTMRQLMDLNNINNPNLIYAGQRLIISISADAAPVSGSGGDLPITIRPSGIQHVVQPGERLSGIAERYGVSWLAIAQLNNIADPNRIEAGQTLLIPSAANSAVAPTLFAPDAPPPTRTVGRELIVSLSNFRTYAYEDGRLVRSILVSIGREATPTVVGSFTIQRKYPSQTMSGPGYYLPGVPFVMYFYAGYAFHGTYWHDNWGARMSHGCINLPTPEAEWLYNFADIGTPVTILA